jgi:hypothetical protein
MFLFKLITTLILRVIELINNTYATERALISSLRNVFGNILDIFIISILVCFIAKHIADLRVESFDFYNSGAIAAVLIIFYGYSNYFRNYFLFSWLRNSKDGSFITEFCIIEESFRVYSAPYILGKVLYIPLVNIVLIGEKLNLVVSTNQLILLCQSEILFFKRITYPRIFLFLTTLLFFIPSLIYLKKAFNSPKDHAFSLFLLFWTYFYLLLNGLLKKKVMAKVDLSIYRTAPQEYREALKKFRSYLFFNLKLNKYNKFQKQISFRISKLCK